MESNLTVSQSTWRSTWKQEGEKSKKKVPEMGPKCLRSRPHVQYSTFAAFGSASAAKPFGAQGQISTSSQVHST